MTLLLAMLFSPAIVLAFAIVVVSIAKSKQLPKSSLKSLLLLTLLFGVAGAVTTLLITLGWMSWYEHSTGFSAANAPVGWIFFFGPLGVALGQLCALIVWWFKRPSKQVL